MPKVLLNSGSSSPQGLPTKMRLNISSNSRRTPNRSSNSLSVVYRFFISSSSIKSRLPRRLSTKVGGNGGRLSIFRPDWPARPEQLALLGGLRAPPLPRNEGQGSARSNLIPPDCLPLRQGRRL